MEALTVLVFLVQGLIQYPQTVGHGLDEATSLRMELRAKYLNQEMTRLLQELEQSPLERAVRAWGALLWAAFELWQFWALVGVLGFLFTLQFSLRKRNCCELHSSGPQDNASSNLEVEEDEEKDNGVAKKEGKSDHANVKEDSKDGNAEDGGCVDTNKEDDFGNEGKEETEDANGEKANDDLNVEEDNKDGNAEDGSHVDTNEEDDVENEGKDETEDENEDQVIGSANVEEDNAAGREERKYGANGDKEQESESELGRLIEERIRWPVLDRGCMITGLIDDLTSSFGHCSSNHFYPVPQRAIGVGSAFEGWTPRNEEVVYRVLVPLNPPTGYTFHLEWDTAGKMPGKNFCIRVESVCTCTREQLGEKVLCLLHSPEEELRRNEMPSLLYNLCTGSYLDVEKTTQWFYLVLKANWLLLPQSYHWHLRFGPSRRSCKFRMTKGRESFRVEVLFGVQQGDSDIYVSSQPTEALFTPSTVWPETYAVVEIKFFRHIAQQAPQDSCHLKCLQLLARPVVGTAFSAYTLKTVVMHLLNTIPLSQWRRKDFLQRLVDSLDYLCSSLKKKHLTRFVIGNQSIPVEINLPPDFQTVKPPNLFWHLAQDPDAHKEAMKEYLCLRHRLKELLIVLADMGLPCDE